MAKKLVKYSVVDAFTDSAFKGNPAAVCLLEEERDEQWLQAVAAEFNISGTCYLTRLSGSDSLDSPNPRFRLRWFTPVAEIELCGHATLAAAHTLFSSGLVNSNIIEFVTLSGILTAKKFPETKESDSSVIQNGEVQEAFLIELNFPTVETVDFNSVEVSSISSALNGASVIDIKKTTSDALFVVVPSGETVVEIQPQIDAIRNCPGMGIIVSGAAPSGSGFDFYSRVFWPKLGINERESESVRERKHHVDEDRVVGAEAADLVRRPVQLPGDGVMVQSRRQAESLASRSPRVLDQMVQLILFVGVQLFPNTVLGKKLGKCDFVAYAVDAFTDSVFKGNPAAVCFLEEDQKRNQQEWLQVVAAEFNIPTTCYLTRLTDTQSHSPNPRFRLRWFTPVAEVKICGHATLAAAHTLFTSSLLNSNVIEFVTVSGTLTARKVPEIQTTDDLNIQNRESHESFLIELDFPTIPMIDFNSAEFSSISNALNGASVIDIKRTTTEDDLIVMCPSLA
uniref:Uncharacterized protein n=1 Tax=Fagus sylvatica TaxID=28930 RepID=A0A2N9GW52_FAGSY